MSLYKSSRNIRLKQYDYHTGWFFVTNKTDFAKDYFKGNIRSLIKEELMNLVKNTSGIGLDYFHIMPNHIHVILIFNNTTISLSEFWRRFKAITTIKAKKIGFNDKTLWQKNYYEHIIRNEAALEKIREYIYNNPLKQNLPLEEIYEAVTIKA
jgi:REP element-mobilizing transposase RayT